ncbi:DsrE family protein [Chenggangzhangella methanolivorans]|uniref:DsrE family protein n=1 Tax=Chenggangzhangella methanolivorans TaxID=1437009 RepID=A0A9E6RID3_9HYPH|nr:DsrE family protein [Chenggangzhangella methanolivorans]QZO02016.1 DsrE family protein [Chenggangzhangella methanolivorans]
MNDISRRSLVAGMALGGAALAADTAKAAPTHMSLDDLKKEGEVAALYHCDYGDVARFEQTLNNISNHYSAYNGDPFALQIALIAHGGGIKFFLDSLDGTMWKDEKLPSDLFERANSLSKNGLKVYLCEITFKRNKLDPSRARPADFISFVPSGVATVAALQGKGFAYVKVG